MNIDPLVESVGRRFILAVWEIPQVQVYFSSINDLLQNLGFLVHIPVTPAVPVTPPRPSAVSTAGASPQVPAELQGHLNNDNTCSEVLEKGKGRCSKPRGVGSPYCTYHTNRRKKSGLPTASLTPAGRVVPCFDERGIVLVPVNQTILNEIMRPPGDSLPMPPLTPYVGGLPLYVQQ